MYFQGVSTIFIFQKSYLFYVSYFNKTKLEIDLILRIAIYVKCIKEKPCPLATYEHPIKILFQEMYMLSRELLKDNFQLEELCYVVDI